MEVSGQLRAVRFDHSRVKVIGRHYTVLLKLYPKTSNFTGSLLKGTVYVLGGGVEYHAESTRGEQMTDAVKVVESAVTPP